MKNTKLKIIALLMLLFVLGASVVGCTNNESPEEVSKGQEMQDVSEDQEEINIVASTSWTAYIAKGAGAKNVITIAPIDLRHPPEYDFKPSDIEQIQNADFIVMAGYEPFMRKIIESNDIDEEKIINVRTTNTFENLKEQTEILAQRLDTKDEQKIWIDELEGVVNTLKANMKEKDMENMKVLAHAHVAEFVTSLGFDVVSVFSADDSSPAKIAELAAMEHSLIIDNFHNPQGEAISAISQSEIVVLRNFPAPEHKSLIDLFKENGQKLGIY